MHIHDKGLTTTQATELYARWGANVLPEKSQPSNVAVFISQLKNPLVFVLLVAGVVTILLHHVSDSLLIFLAVFINTILGFIQEKRANQAFMALNRFIVHEAEVVRDGKRIKVDTTQVVPGDVVVLSQGARVPADGELLFVNRVYIDEAIMTGESVPVTKQVGESVFMGTTIMTGQALMRVTKTGAQTSLGAIATSIQEVERDTPLKRQLTMFSRKLVVIIAGLLSVVLLVGLVRGQSFMELFATSVALAVSSIPEGLVVSLTVVLAIGMQKILKRRGLVRKLASAETLGGVTTICVDKTGTLTEGKMQVVETVGDEQALATQVLLANDLDDPIVIAAHAWGQQTASNDLTDHDRLDSIPFSPRERFFASLHRWSTTANMVFVNAAPEVVLEWTTLSAAEKEKVLAIIEKLTAQGRRVMGFAQREVAANVTTLSSNDIKQDLIWVGLIAFSDPVRTSVKDSLLIAKQAGIAITVITGDYANTAEYVLQEIGLAVKPEEVLTGEDIEKLSVAELAAKVQTIRLFARTTPDQKHTIVAALQQRGEVVAMMGDGVNDAPAIHQADIGIVVNEASDVSRESADLVLLDSDFSTVVAAIEEGRSIFDNIRKTALYLLSDAFAEIVLVVGSIVLGLPLPLTAVQIIWINLVSDGFPNLALTIDPQRADIMKEPPRSPQEKLINHWMVALIATVSVLSGGIALVAFASMYWLTGDRELARSLAFVIVGLDSLAYVFSVRSLLDPFWKNNMFKNKWLIGAVGVGLSLQVLPFLTAGTRNFFKVVELEWFYWVLAFCLAIAVFFAIEMFKAVWGRFGVRGAK